MKNKVLKYKWIMFSETWDILSHIKDRIRKHELGAQCCAVLSAEQKQRYQRVWDAVLGNTQNFSFWQLKSNSSL